MSVVLYVLLFAAGPSADCDGGCPCGCAVTNLCRCEEYAVRYKTYAAWKDDVHRRRRKTVTVTAVKAVPTLPAGTVPCVGGR